MLALPLQALALVKRRRNARGPGGGVGEEDNIDDIDMITRPASKRLDTVVELQREVEKLQVWNTTMLTHVGGADALGNLTFSCLISGGATRFGPRKSTRRAHAGTSNQHQQRS